MTSKKMAEIEISDSIKVSGFTLIEVLVAIAIFSIGFLAVGSMHISATSNNLSAGCAWRRRPWLQDKWSN